MRNLHIGILVDEISNVFSQLICGGAYEACQEIGARLSIFFGGFYMNTFQEYGYQKNMIYPLANTSDLDFLIVSISSICRSTSNKQKIIEYFNNVPIITLNQEFEGLSSVLIDNEKGLKEGLEYIFMHSAFRSFAMVAGPQNNNGSNIRKRVFEQVLKEHGLEEEIYVEHAPIMERTSKDTIRKIFKNKPETNVLICANDELAVGAYEICRELKREVGKDILILGFDDIHEASCLQPGLSSIRSPIDRLGYNAVLLGVEQLRTQKVNSIVLPTKFVLRNSFGNHDFLTGPLLGEITAFFTKKITFEEFWTRVVDYLQEDIAPLKEMMISISEMDLRDSSIFENLDHSVFDFFATSLLNMHLDLMKLMELLEHFTHNAILYTNFDDDQQMFNAHRHCERIAHQLASQLNTNLMMLENVRYEETLQINTLARKVMMFTNEKECQENILGALADLDIHNAQVYLYDHDVECTSCTELPDTIHLWGEIVDGQVRSTLDRDEVVLSNIMKNSEHWSTERPVSVLSIYSNAKLFGYILCDVLLEKYATMEFLSIHIATSLKTLQLMKDLTNRSRIDALTGLYNRRGMEEKVGEYFHLNKKKGKGDFYILLADIDGLKVINDTYGHKAGDIAIKKGTYILQRAFGKNAFLVRMGGDEFLAIVKKEKAEDIEKALEVAQTRINQETLLPIDTNLSYGIKKIEDIDAMDLDDLLKEVDLLMYKHKKTKKKKA